MDESLFNALTEELFETVYNEKASFKLSDEEKPFELTGWPMPVDDRFFLCHDLDYSAFFDVDTSEEAEKRCIKLANKRYAKAIKNHGVVDLLDGLFFETFGDGLAPLVLNTFFWILYHKGKQWISVRSYAIEVLKWIPTYIFDFFDDYEDFIKVLSLYIPNTLCSMGICTFETESGPEDTNGGRYSIQATDAFYTLLKPSEQAVARPLEE